MNENLAGRDDVAGIRRGDRDIRAGASAIRGAAAQSEVPGDIRGAGARSELPGDIRVGVIGVGMMGADHVDRLQRRIKGARVTAVFDADATRSHAVSARIPGCEESPTPINLITSDAVDAVVIASPGRYHRDQAIACIQAGKPVLCEKPLAMNPEDAYQVVEAEHKSGGRYLSLGFMRRFDPEYIELKAAMDSGELGEISVINCKHRNAYVHSGFRDEMMVYDSAIHEIDTVSFLLGEPIVQVQTVLPTPSANAHPGQHDPMIFLFTTASGKIVTDELYVNTRSGYEVRTEVLGSRGIATIGLQHGRITTHTPGAQWGGKLPEDFRPRFAAAYDSEFQAWIHAIADGSNIAPQAATAWDGYVAAATCEAAEKSLTEDGFVAVALQEPPE
ncbi:Gfo/Idh/MocA family protein [Devriesea agamarum]|uniref:Gfo/Idh/MocA family protein n=1 Tax=Devriesea agamarum TaxID=472569 RepID=UPI000A07889B|nr:Gfo/Idh/MocA family oxidoreductase [Devriesea agamarum]